MGNIAPASGAGAAKVDRAEAQRKAREALQKAAAARLAGRVRHKVKVAAEARKAALRARSDAEVARQGNAAAVKAAADVPRVAATPGHASGATKTPADVTRKPEVGDSGSRTA